MLDLAIRDQVIEGYGLAGLEKDQFDVIIAMLHDVIPTSDVVLDGMLSSLPINSDVLSSISAYNYMLERKSALVA